MRDAMKILTDSTGGCLKFQEYNGQKTYINVSACCGVQII